MTKEGKLDIKSVSGTKDDRTFSKKKKKKNKLALEVTRARKQKATTTTAKKRVF